MIDSDLVKLLRCPETRQTLVPAGAGLLADLNRQVAEGRLLNRAGRKVREALEEGLVREDGTYLYPVRDRIPVMLVEESIRLRDAG